MRNFLVVGMVCVGAIAIGVVVSTSTVDRAVVIGGVCGRCLFVDLLFFQPQAALLLLVLLLRIRDFVVCGVASKNYR